MKTLAVATAFATLSTVALMQPASATVLGHGPLASAASSAADYQRMDAKARKGSKRAGGKNSKGKGSRYTGGRK